MYNMNAQSFIEEINALIAQERNIRQEQLERGERFNIFQILGVTSDEVNTHSSLIAELLNPNGSHGCGDLFLRVFIEQIPQLNELNLNLTHVRTCVEYSIGELSANYDEGGRIDILIEADNKGIVIENKIYAGDQPKQLLRYHNFAQKRYRENFRLLYLTLHGKNPSVESTTNILSENDYTCISYACDIKNWLNMCIDKVGDKALLKATLEQYVNLINRLTHQDMDTQISSQLADLCTKPENIEAFVWMYENYETMINRIMNDVFVPQLEEIAQRNGLKFQIKEDCGKSNGKPDWINTRYMRFDFYKPEWKCFWLSFEFQSLNMRRCVWGFRYKSNELRGKSLDNKQAINNILHGNMSEGWAVFNYIKPDNWISKEVISKIYNEKTMMEEIEQIIKTALPQVKHLL